MKKPWLSALLNIILGGVGYLYNGKRILFGTLILINNVLAYFWMSTVSDEVVTAQFSQPTLLLAGLVTIIAFAYDAYQEAQQLNRKKS